MHRPAAYTFVVYAPFGSDKALSHYPLDVNGGTAGVEQHPLFLALQRIARDGNNVCALIDRVDDYSWFIEGRAGARQLRVQRAGKLRMDDPRSLADLLLRARRSFPTTPLVLALEGHGAGYLPHVDRSQLTPERLSDGGSLGRIHWRIDDAGAVPYDDDGNPLIGMGSPLLPAGSPMLPASEWPLTTAGLEQALQWGLGPRQRVAVVHLNNCFNMSIELLATLAPHAEHATGYMNYNFYSGGLSYPAVLRRARDGASSAEVARLFALGNQAMLGADYPTTGASVDLKRFRGPDGIGARFLALAAALRAALAAHPVIEAGGIVTLPPARQQVVDAIRDTLERVQRYDSATRYRLDSEDELLDVLSLAHAFVDSALPDVAVRGAATALRDALKDIRVYGERGVPQLGQPDPVAWDLDDEGLAMNVLCPDPALKGLWDWRSAFYLQTTPSDVQPLLIDFLSQDDSWIGFIVEYHRGVPFRGFRPASIPAFPAKPYRRGNDGGGDGGGSPDQPPSAEPDKAGAR